MVRSQRAGPHMYSLILSNGRPRDHSLPAPCSPGTCTSSREVESPSLHTKKGSGDSTAKRQALACQEGPGPTSTKTGIDQSVRMPINPVL